MIAIQQQLNPEPQQSSRARLEDLPTKSSTARKTCNGGFDDDLSIDDFFCSEYFDQSAKESDNCREVNTQCFTQGGLAIERQESHQTFASKNLPHMTEESSQLNEITENCGIDALCFIQDTDSIQISTPRIDLICEERLTTNRHDSCNVVNKTAYGIDLHDESDDYQTPIKSRPGYPGSRSLGGKRITILNKSKTIVKDKSKRSDKK